MLDHTVIKQRVRTPTLQKQNVEGIPPGETKLLLILSAPQGEI